VARTVLAAAWPLAALWAGAALWLVPAYRHDLQAQRARLQAGSTAVATGCGNIEIGQAGAADAPVLLVVHGSGGGFDQGLAIGRDFVPRGTRVLAPSRFGYLRTPLPDDAPAERRADRLACVLDAMGVRDGAVMGVSANAVSALHFAIRHAQRTRARVLLVPAAYRPAPAVPMTDAALRVLHAAINADLPFWTLRRLVPGTARTLVLATPSAAYAAAGDDEKLGQVLPASARRAGLRNDSRLSTGAQRVALESIRAPTLCISARDDGFGAFESARYSAAHIAGARMLGFDRGGHLLLGHRTEVVDAGTAPPRDAGFSIR
jgi:pimeloyl-ACP methyl ester carboxylesterase